MLFWLQTQKPRQTMPSHLRLLDARDARLDARVAGVILPAGLRRAGLLLRVTGAWTRHHSIVISLLLVCLTFTLTSHLMWLIDWLTDYVKWNFSSQKLFHSSIQNHAHKKFTLQEWNHNVYKSDLWFCFWLSLSQHLTTLDIDSIYKHQCIEQYTKQKL